MLAADYIALGALAVAVLSLGFSLVSQFSQSKYVKTQDALNKLLLEKEKFEKTYSSRAEISASVVSMGSNNQRIRVYNKGHGDAFQVEIKFMEDAGWLIINEVFPLDKMIPGQSVDLPMTLVLSSERKCRTVLRWKSESGEEFSRELVLAC